MLVRHADAPGDGIRGRGPNALLAANENLPGVRPQHAVEDLHGGGLACAVFPDDAMNCAGLDPQVHPGVSQHAAELFGQSAQLNCWKGMAGHFCGSVRIWQAESNAGLAAPKGPGLARPLPARDGGGDWDILWRIPILSLYSSSIVPLVFLYCSSSPGPVALGLSPPSFADGGDPFVGRTRCGADRAWGW